MSTENEQDWRIYRGDGQVHTGWQPPEPPIWRPRRSAAAAKVVVPPLSEAASHHGSHYKSSEEIVRIVNAAMHLRRPLLITGAPGTGKSTLVDAIAYELDLGEPLRWSVTSRSTLHDALYSYDAIGRAQHREAEMRDGQPLDIGHFIRLGPLGTAMLPADRPRVLLIDEIDKADIDLPNDLLNVLEEGRFHIPELGRLGKKTYNVLTRDGEPAAITGGDVECFEYPLVVMTSNGERDFPAPFLRRCLQLRMPDPCENPERLRAIVEAHLGDAMANNAAGMIEHFIQRAQDGEILATDQLLNAVQLVMGAYAMSDKDRLALADQLTVSLGRKP
ncbi:MULTISPECIES: MoxR family ATPase [unclassified Janthinobacterium]|uniref:AAA family ATPase n=1 Tax=unclassified Janthinobacterium TaxID=2610881 RepID=UPI0008883722|nr:MULTISPECIES: MoxR family ATPase [unclassified Janthinobacterium]SDA57594.1 AAA domain (dynein-related subfamily) [Janthinobacterium sp. 551a]SFB28691.1 AAA domain (dynein-related subfamily) [Janthinobacterium sp. 344]